MTREGSALIILIGNAYHYHVRTAVCACMYQLAEGEKPANDLQQHVLVIFSQNVAVSVAN
jgi:hypothetical protein